MSECVCKTGRESGEQREREGEREVSTLLPEYNILGVTSKQSKSQKQWRAENIHFGADVSSVDP